MSNAPSRIRRLGFALSCGILWGGAVIAVDALVQPREGLPATALLSLVLAIGWTWIVSGIGWALAALWLEHCRPGLLLLAIAPIALAFTVFHLVAWRAGIDFALDPGVAEMLGEQPPVDVIFFHELWLNLFYGGLYLFGFVGLRRAQRAREMLSGLARARAEGDSERQQARLHAVRGQVRPATLIDAVAALRDAYAATPAHAEKLLQALVAFLRAAMPGLRGKPPTLAAELDLIAAYARLHRSIGGNNAPSIDVASPDQVPRLPFPPLCLLPAIDALAQALAPDGGLSVRTQRHPAGVRLIVVGTGLIGSNGLPPDVLRRLQLGLAALFGQHHSFAAYRDEHRLTLDITLPLSDTENLDLALEGAPA